MRLLRGLGLSREKLPHHPRLQVPSKGRGITSTLYEFPFTFKYIFQGRDLHGVRAGRLGARREDLPVRILRGAPMRGRPVRAPGLVSGETKLKLPNLKYFKNTMIVLNCYFTGDRGREPEVPVLQQARPVLLSKVQDLLLRRPRQEERGQVRN